MKHKRLSETWNKVTEELRQHSIKRGHKCEMEMTAMQATSGWTLALQGK